MKGFVPTPRALVDVMVDKLFRAARPNRNSTLLDPGCGEGEFIAGVLRWCEANQSPVPRILGVEQHPKRAAVARNRFANRAMVVIETADFLVHSDRRFDYIIGNPPYVSIGKLTVEERNRHRARFAAANGRFDLYMLFFEQALQMLTPNGRLVFVTPEKFTYVESARVLRELLLRHHVDELHYLDETSFEGFVTYPLVTTVDAQPASSPTTVIDRHAKRRQITLHGNSSWQAMLGGVSFDSSNLTLADVCLRVSCGIATGADAAFVVQDTDLDEALRRFAYPTISGRQLGRFLPARPQSHLLIPYDRRGRLLPESRLGVLGRYLQEPERHALLTARTCIARKPWYSYHDSAPLDEILRPKILCKDISPAPHFVADVLGEIVPRHSTYYIVPKDPSQLIALMDYLNSPEATRWLTAHCQRAANGFVRLQSSVLKRLPVPSNLAVSSAPADQLDLPEVASFA